MSSISAPAVGALPVLVDDEQMSDTGPASIADGSEKTDSVSRALAKIAQGDEFHELAIGGANCAMDEYPPDVPPNMVYIPEVTQRMREAGYELCLFKVQIPSYNLNDESMIYKIATTSAAARYEQILDEREVAHIIGHGPPEADELLYEIALDDGVVIEITSRERNLLTRPTLVRAAEDLFVAKFFARVEERRLSGRAREVDIVTVPT